MNTKRKEKTVIQGYIYTWSPKHPYKNSQQRVAEHRLIMEKYNLQNVARLFLHMILRKR